jgi:quercetin dioxygenase-like cupin family protein
MMLRKAHVAALGAFALMAISSAAASTISPRAGGFSQVNSLVPTDHPVGLGATVTPVFSKRITSLDKLFLSTYLIDYPPGASAELHHMPSSGYVLTYVLSGAIHASAWRAGVGIYRAGETWVEPAFAHRIATANTSQRDSARALVVLVTDSQGQSGANDTAVAGPAR